MAEIILLNQTTIDQIAAGEVVERPASVVKELVENAIDAGADAIAVEIKEGGISFIRVTDNGCGIPKNQIEKAFLRHATSKIRTAEDLNTVASLGFRGEALSSIAAVAQVEVITKVEDALTGIRYILENHGQSLQSEMQEIGAPNGTTFIIRNLFFNVPVRKKFLKQFPTEGGYIADIMEHMALSRPDISFKFINHNQTKFHTSGNGDLKEVIYRIFGRETLNCLLPVAEQQPAGGMKLTGYLGKPDLTRSNRNFEVFFVNGRFVKSEILSKSVEEGYKQFLMQHKFPFVVLQLHIDTTLVDVNVHPTKMDIRFMDSRTIADFLTGAVEKNLRSQELIPNVALVKNTEPPKGMIKAPEPFEVNRLKKTNGSMETNNHPYETDCLVGMESMSDLVAEETEYKTVEQEAEQKTSDQVQQEVKDAFEADILQRINQSKVLGAEFARPPSQNDGYHANVIKAQQHILVEKPAQLTFFDEKFLTQNAREHYQILGQIFETYWLISFKDKLVFMDQHAAHEKVKYERFIRQLSAESVQSQTVSPPIIVQLSGKEESVLQEYFDYFAGMGFEIEEFGENTIAVRSVPTDLYGCQEKELFLEILDELSEGAPKGPPTVIRHKIASMACKAAVKGNMRLEPAELESLITELLSLENPYHCPHGRPTMFAMSQYEIEKKFKRII